MARPRTQKTGKTLNFDNEVLVALEEYCRREKILVSTFVNSLVRHAVLSEYQFYRGLARFHNSEFHKYKLMMDSAPDKPK